MTSPLAAEEIGIIHDHFDGAAVAGAFHVDSLTKGPPEREMGKGVACKIGESIGDVQQVFMQMKREGARKRCGVSGVVAAAASFDDRGDVFASDTAINIFCSCCFALVSSPRVPVTSIGILFRRYFLANSPLKRII
jgi:hypothetical protein